MPVENAQSIPLNVVGGSTFGLYPKISVEKTFNMFVSDNWMVNYAGYKRVAEGEAGDGRGIFYSTRGNFMLVVTGTAVYRYDTNLTRSTITTLTTTQGQVYMAENLASQILIVDGQNAYLYDYSVPVTTTLTLTNSLGQTIVPGHVEYHNTYFLVSPSPTSLSPENWYVYEKLSTTELTRVKELKIQTKPDKALAVRRIPGAGNNVMVFGGTVSEIWTQVGSDDVYRRVQSTNIDNGVVNIATIGAAENQVFWLGQNEKGSRSIFTSDGSQAFPISTDGIDQLLERLDHPEDSVGFCYRQDGHLFYQLTFYNDNDNLTLFYDTRTQSFYNASDENLDYYPARNVAYFNNTTYFVSLRDNGVYEMGDEVLSYSYDLNDTSNEFIIPRLRFTKAIRQANSSPFRVGSFTFWLEQGVNNYLDSDTDKLPRVDVAMSKNGGQTYSSFVSRDLNRSGNYRNIIGWNNLGQANEVVFQIRFHGFQRFVANNGVLEVY